LELGRGTRVTTLKRVAAALGAWLLTGMVLFAGTDSTIYEPPYVWDWVIIPRVHFEQVEVRTALDFAQAKCREEQHDQKVVTFEYHFNPLKAHKTVTLDLRDVHLVELLTRICLPNDIRIHEKPGKIIFTDSKN
jgi:hypothetical protein